MRGVSDKCLRGRLPTLGRSYVDPDEPIDFFEEVFKPPSDDDGEYGADADASDDPGWEQCRGVRSDGERCQQTNPAALNEHGYCGITLTSTIRTKDNRGTGGFRVFLPCSRTLDVNQTKFEKNSPEIASRFGTDFWTKMGPEHPIRHNLERDNTTFFDYLSRLTNQSPVDKIASQYQNDLHDDGQFRAFLSEMIGYIATERWLCSNPTVLDVKGSNGLPEFECDEFDVEVARILESTEIDRVRARLQDEVGGGCTVFVEKKPKYDDYASGNPAWSENEIQIQELLDKLGEVESDEVPITVETDALRLRVVESDTDDVGYFGRSSPVEIVPDEDRDISNRLRDKAEKQRESRSIVVFLDLDIQSVGSVREVIDQTIGEQYGFAFADDVVVSKHVKGADPVWEDYLKQIGAKPDGDTSRCPAIQPGDEGVFVEEEVSCIAGVMVRFYFGAVAYIPNVYTEEVDVKSVYDHLGWGLETRSLRLGDL